MSTENELELKIDAVIAWVDGNDLNWQKKINKYLKVKKDFSKKKNLVRYNSIGEIDITIKSILKFAPFIKKIFLVTDNQKPQSFQELQLKAKKLNRELILVDHKIIFKNYEEFLPCFNSCSIGNMLYKIPDLSEKFIIFNDDTFLMRLTKPSDFFYNDFPVLRGKWEKYYENQKLRIFYHNILKKINKKFKVKSGGFKTFQQTSAKLAGTKNYLRRFHTPVSVRKSTLNNFFKNNNILSDNIKFRFRDKKQFIISSLSEHLEIKNSTFKYRKNKQLTYFRSYKNKYFTIIKLWLFSVNKKKLFMTFQSLEMADKKSFNYITHWIDNRIS